MYIFHYISSSFLLSNFQNTHTKTPRKHTHTTQKHTMGSSKSSSFWRFDSPLIYLFGGITLILLLIVVALVILACSQRRRRSAAGSDVENSNESQKTANTVFNGSDETDKTPKVVVIMPGDQLPTYLATPVVAAGDTSVSN